MIKLFFKPMTLVVGYNNKKMEDFMIVYKNVKTTKFTGGGIND